MGRPKASLPWAKTTLVAHVAGVLAGSLDGPVVVVRAPGQALPELAPAIELAEDAHPGRGPLEGLAAGLRAVGDRADAVYLSATDVPLLRPAFVRAVVGSLADGDAAVPVVGERIHPLAAAYRVTILPVVERLLADGTLRALDLLEELCVTWLAEDDLRPADPELASLRNLNTPEEYAAALARRA
jgi:molybdopterin-guanine dinucleotide biosynthesis protein A